MTGELMSASDKSKGYNLQMYGDTVRITFKNKVIWSKYIPQAQSRLSSGDVQKVIADYEAAKQLILKARDVTTKYYLSLREMANQVKTKYPEAGNALLSICQREQNDWQSISSFLG